jgi:hypothetical protein
MADTIRELILQDIVSQLQTLTIANGYNTSCGQSVARARMEIAIADLPAISIIPGEESAQKGYGEQLHTMPLEVHALHKRGDLDMSVLAEQMLGDLISCLVGGQDSISYIDSLAYTGGGVDEWPAPEDQALSVRASLEVEYTTVIGDPYTQP